MPIPADIRLEIISSRAAKKSEFTDNFTVATITQSLMSQVINVVTDESH
jgi:hypothetical protein